MPTASQQIAKNSLWNLFGNVLPGLLGIVTIPLIIQNIGIESMGILTLIWTCIGYFNLFDFGVGRALTFTISSLIGQKKWQEISFHIFSGLLMIFLFGLLGTALVLSGRSFILTQFFNPSSSLGNVTYQSLFWMGISLPFVLLTTGIRGVLESFSAFRELNLIKTLMGFFNYLSPYIVSLWTKRLDHIVLILVIGRIIFTLAHFWILEKYLHQHPESSLEKKWWTKKNWNRFQWFSEEMKVLFAFSGWMTLSNIIGPLMVYADRFFIAKSLTAGETAYYTIPFEAVTKLWILPGALAGVLFPAFAQMLQKDQQRLDFVFGQSFKVFALILLPIAIIVGIFSENIMTLWLGLEFASKSYLIFTILTFGVIINCFAQISFALVQGSGATKITAFFHFIELPFYIPVVYFLTSKMGIQGTALAWTIRVAFDFILLLGYTHFKIHRKLFLHALWVGVFILFYFSFVIGLDSIIHNLGSWKEKIIVQLFAFSFCVVVTVYILSKFWMKNDIPLWLEKFKSIFQRFLKMVPR